MSDILEIDRFRSYFSKAATFTIDNIVSFYSPSKIILRETIKWRIYRLSKMGIIHNVGRGWKIPRRMVVVRKNIIKL